MGVKALDQIIELWHKSRLKPKQVIFGILGIGAVILSIPSFQKHQAQIEADKQAIETLNSQKRILARQFEYEQEQQIIANERYKNCLPVVGEVFKNGRHYFSGISEGQVISDRISQKPLPSGTVVCDANGSTGVIGSKGKVSHIAFTGDRNIIKKRLSRFKYSQYSQPIISTK